LDNNYEEEPENNTPTEERGIEEENLSRGLTVVVRQS